MYVYAIRKTSSNEFQLIDMTNFFLIILTVNAISVRFFSFFFHLFFFYFHLLFRENKLKSHKLLSKQETDRESGEMTNDVRSYGSVGIFMLLNQTAARDFI